MDYKKLVIYVGLSIVFALMVFDFYHGVSERMNAKNPDPNHTHANFAVWVHGKQYDFAQAKYMSGSSTDESTHPHAGPRQYLHLHDGNGHVIHRHKPGLTFGDFLKSLGFRYVSGPISSLTTDTREVFRNGREEVWRLMVNGEPKEFTFDLDFQDGDGLLFSFGADNAELEREWKQMKDDACLYSKTCPWRGDPPVENCIADPMVPCVGT